MTESLPTGSCRTEVTVTVAYNRGCALAAATLAVLTLAGCTGTQQRVTAQSPSVLASSPASASSGGLSLVVIGDSIPYNSPAECPGCTGFADRYADELSKATGRHVEVTNLSQHNSLTLPGLLDELDTFRPQLSSADAIIVAIAHNSISLNADKPCGATFDVATNQLSDWSKVDARCAARSAATMRPKFAELYSRIASWRAGKPTILRTINKYSDWIGWEEAHLTPSQEKKTILQHDVWNKMLCATARANSFTCADIYHAFNGPDGSRPSGDLLGADYTHPSDKGNELIARVLVSEGFAELT